MADIDKTILIFSCKRKGNITQTNSEGKVVGGIKLHDFQVSTTTVSHCAAGSRSGKSTEQDKTVQDSPSEVPPTGGLTGMKKNIVKDSLLRS